jgi:WD40 repeat protein/biotin carboxyl carrier protein
MLRRIILPALTGALAFTAIACEPKLPPNPKTIGGSTPSAEVARLTPAEIGSPLYEPAAAQVRPATPPDAAGVPIEIEIRGCQVTLPRTENVPSKYDGKLIEYCTEFDPAKEPVPDNEIVFHPRTKKQYRRLKVGDTVKKDQLIAILDDTLENANYEIALAAVKAGESKKVANQEILKAALEEYGMYVRLRQTGAAPDAEVRRASAQAERARAEVAEAEGQVLKSQEEQKKAKVILDEHEIRADIAGEMKRFYRRAGESIKAYDPVAEIQNFDEMRVEGMVEVQNRILGVKVREAGPHPKVVVERAEQTARELALEGHNKPVWAVAVSKDPKKPLIVSASEDKTVKVWDRTGDNIANWRHDAPVRAVACTPKTAEADLCLTGADDGIARLWDLGNLAATKPLREMKGRHQQRIVFAAFAPHGKLAATADDREIILWDVDSGEVKYRISNPHNGPLTSLQFTPQCTLVTAGSDRTIRIWKLGDKGASPEMPFEHRTGDVPVLGVSADGHHVLFDQDKELHVRALADQRTEGVLHAPSETTKFITLAQFSPDGRLVIAAGTGDNPLQIWRAPAPGIRASMLRRLAVGPTSMPTCAAFAPDGSFAVTGTLDHKVLVWGLPDDQEIKRQITATITYVDRSIESAEGKVRIWAEKLAIPPGLGLLAGETVTLIVTPQGPAK